LGLAGESGGGRRCEAVEVGGHGLASRFPAVLAACGAALPSCGAETRLGRRRRRWRRAAGWGAMLWR
jgi:hypothetical protein